ncbi:apolipoprotein N-acyltransferase [Larsenimonas suaedae]|uniref:Apolipoprotein N-acyltransferase n=1 Tax=Larsenimonas suaedae TaxID=1851019 RepID=A0ABU1GUF7_9GAMM|nr:apolipoprotein N-acyltransferase [Larsenimonas suaedae]MCM2970927.1 apolipoprotein N-acyltransferase [Larsenimonas suaedae]MDR5895636.1 apolipoprotein N-acyltransferase [Larsenimonas suaedae]
MKTLTSPLHDRPWLSDLLTLGAGAAMTLTFAPFNAWWLAPLLMALVFTCAQRARLKRMLWRGWLFGVGLFGTGTSWVYVSIHDFGYTGAPLALFLTALFVATLALFYMAMFGLYRFCRPRGLLNAWAFAGIWVIGELFRSWAFTGFPWLYLGSAQVDSPINTLAPLGGVYLLSFVIALTGGLIARLVERRSWVAAVMVALLWLSPSALPLEWAVPLDTPKSVALVQGDLAQLDKWTPDGQRQAANTYASLTRRDADNAEIIVWPETALPMLEQQAIPFLERMQATLDSETTLITGLVQQDAKGHYFNSVITLGDGHGVYKKAHLVPFGEYLPLDSLLRGLIDFFNLPMSDFKAGPSDPEPLHADGLSLGVAICYEIVYPDLVRQRAHSSDALLTVSNDSWFGHSIGPLQHMQMARLRALENNRYLLRATSNGLTAIVDSTGKITAKAPRFEPAVLTGMVYPMKGMTPFTVLGSWPAGILAALMALTGALVRLVQKRKEAAAA